MADLANLVLAVDSTQVAKGTAALDGLTAAGARAEAATVGLGSGFKGAGAEASAMALAAQASARAAMDQAAGFKLATDAARVNTIAMRETLVVARELARGNFTRIPGSLSLLAQGIGSQGGIGAFLSAISQQIGLVKTLQNAELAEAAAAAASAAAGVEAAARKAAAAVMAADTEVALAEAQVRVTEGTTAEAAAQVRLAAAHDAVAAAAAEAAVAEEALATAMGRSAEAGAASAAATRTVIGGTGVGLIGLGLVAGIAYGAIKQLQDQVKDDGTLTQFRDNLGLTHQEMLRLSDGTEKVGKGIKELTDVAPTFGDVMHGVFAEIAREANDGSAWDKFKGHASDAFSGILDVWNKTSAALSAGLWTLGDIAKDVFEYIAQKIGQSFYDGVNKAIDALNGLNAHIPKWAGGGDPNLIPHLTPGKPIKDLGSLGSLIRTQADQNYAEALAANNAAYAGIRSGAVQSAEDRMQREADALKADRRPGRQRTQRAKKDVVGDELDKLDSQIASENALAQAYLTSDAAAIKAQADQKALTFAIDHHATAAQTAALKEKELALAIATITEAGAKAIANLNADSAARQKVNAMVAAGLIPAAQANQAIQNELALRQQNAALQLAQENLAEARHAKDQKRIADDIAAIQRLQKVIAGLPVAQASDDAAKAVSAAQQQIASNDNEIEQIRLKNSLLGESNREIAIALANLETMQYLRDHPGIDASTAAGLANSNVQKALANVQTPFQQWAKSIPGDAKAITDALQQIEFKGLDGLASSLADVVTGTKSLGAAFKEVAQSIIHDIIEMTIKMLIFRAISSIFGGGIPAPSGGPVPFVGGFDPAALSAPIPKLAGGGSFIIGGNGGTDNNLLSLNGKPLAMVNQGETLAVFPNRATTNDNSEQRVRLVLELNDDMLQAKIVDGATGVVVQAAPKIAAAGAASAIRNLKRPRLMAGR